MRLANALTIFRRELRDQLRDRRTLMMIFVLPVLLYPILGISMLQLAAAFGKKARAVVVTGAEYLPKTPPLLNARGDGFAPPLFDTPEEASQYRVERAAPRSSWADAGRRRQLLRDGLADAVLIVPPDIAARIAKEAKPAELDIAYDSADEKSRNTSRAVREVLSHWNEQIVQARLKRDAKSESYLQPVRTKSLDVARRDEASASVWGKIFPFLLVLMALTGAFYPAVDLCAGEKERGTMETLLISPASRSEIVLGKFLTVVVFSMGTALLNLAGMAMTGLQLARQFDASSAAEQGERIASGLGRPSFEALGWMILLLVPLSIFFSSLCLALAVMARSMKEGQYYMTPLYLVVMPLVFATLAPGIELDLFTSLVPVTGVALLLRSLMQGEYATARQYFLPVLVPLVVYGLLALRWAVDQFRRESVLFREAERFELRDWLRHLVRDRQPTPNAGMAILSFGLMLTSAWFLIDTMAASPAGLVGGQVTFILVPPVLMTLLFTSSPRRTLRLEPPTGKMLLLAAGLAVALNPLTSELRVVVEALFPIPEQIKAQLGRLLTKIPDLKTAVIVLAIIPAICEELAFRGFILSGLERDFKSTQAIVLSAFLFGFLHVLLSLFQQLFNATLLGVILGLLAVRSRSIVPGIVFHAINNSLAILVGTATQATSFRRWVGMLFRDPGQGLYHGHWVALGGLLSVVLLFLLVRAPGSKPSLPRDPLLDAG